jgi:hypothetical protein
LPVQQKLTGMSKRLWFRPAHRRAAIAWSAQTS